MRPKSFRLPIVRCSPNALLAAIAVAVFLSVNLSSAADDTNIFAISRHIDRGINIGNALDAPAEGEWGITVKEAYFDIIKAAGFESVRIPVRWSAHAQDKPPYTVDSNFLARTDEVIHQALARGFTVVVTMHHYNELYHDPAAQTEKFLAMWRQIAAHYRDYPAQLLFEPLNEPHENLDAPLWNQLIARVLPVIRESNPNRALVLGPANYNDVHQLDTLKLPDSDQNLIVTFHYYLPFQFTHQGAQWVDGSDAWLGTKWMGTEAERHAITTDFNAAAAWGNNHHRPIYLGEFGANFRGDMPSRVRWTKFVADTALASGFTFTYWEFCTQFFGLYDPQTHSWHAELRDAVIPPTP